MKTCTCCNKQLPIGKFSPQRLNPSKLYAYCDDCRSDVEKVLARHNRKSIAEDYRLMREKAKSMRVLTHSQALEIAERRQEGEKVVELASEFKVSTSTVYKAARSPKRYE